MSLLPLLSRRSRTEEKQIMSLLFIILGPLFVWRAVHMIQEESGPGAIFDRFRAWAARNTSDEPGHFFDGLTCFKCCSIWIAGIYSLFLGPNILEWLALTFAISAVAIFINVLFTRK